MSLQDSVNAAKGILAEKESFYDEIEVRAFGVLTKDIGAETADELRSVISNRRVIEDEALINFSYDGALKDTGPFIFGFEVPAGIRTNIVHFYFITEEYPNYFYNLQQFNEKIAFLISLSESGGKQSRIGFKSSRAE